MQNSGREGMDFISSPCVETEPWKVKGAAYVGRITDNLYYLNDLGENLFVDITHKTSKPGPKQDGLKKKQS